MPPNDLDLSNDPTSSSGVLSPFALDAIQGYADRLKDCIAQCTLLAQYDGEAFLWNARRAAEAICLLLDLVKERPTHEKTGERNSEPWRLDGLMEKLKKQQVFDRRTAAALSTIRDHTNIGVHLCTPRRPDYTMNTDIVMAALPNLVRWLFQESPARPYLAMSEELASNLDKLEDHCDHELPLPHQIQHLRSELDRARSLRLKGEEDLALVRGENYNLRRALETAAQERRVETESLRRGLEEAQETTQRAQARSSRMGALVIVPTLLAFALGGALGWGLAPREAPQQEVRTNAENQKTAPVATVPPAAPTVPEPTAPQPAAEPTPEPAVSPPLVHCPEHMVLVPSTRVLLEQLDRDWGDISGPLEPQEVPAFCLDEAPVTVAEAGPPPEAPCDDSPQPQTPDNRRVCITRDEALQVCSRRGANFLLPGILQWEALARTKMETDIRIRPGSDEWVEDTYPPHVFHRTGAPGMGGKGLKLTNRRNVTGDGRTLWSWSRQDDRLRRYTVGFRCAFQPVTGE